VLDLQSNNETHRPLLDAIAMLKAHRDEPTQF
jgi:hypothetical protein